jgi:hypothetical protein
VGFLFGENNFDETLYFSGKRRMMVFKVEGNP